MSERGVYGTETCTIGKSDKNRIEAYEMWCRGRLVWGTKLEMRMVSQALEKGKNNIDKFN